MEIRNPRFTGRSDMEKGVNSVMTVRREVFVRPQTFRWLDTLANLEVDRRKLGRLTRAKRAAQMHTWARRNFIEMRNVWTQ
jgi:hypothetical protein